MAFTKIWIHCVWATKNWNQVLTKDIRSLLFEHIREYASSKNIYIDFINGEKEHIHCLISLDAEQTIAKIMNLIKGESSFWFNKSGISQNKLEWQNEYFAVSVSESALDKVRDYIKGQEEHHKKKNFEDEYKEFMNKYGFDILKKGNQQH